MTRIHWQATDDTPEVIAEGEAEWGEAGMPRPPFAVLRRFLPF